MERQTGSVQVSTHARAWHWEALTKFGAQKLLLKETAVSFCLEVLVVHPEHTHVWSLDGLVSNSPGPP
jgi:hypothetical protein